MSSSNIEAIAASLTDEEKTVMAQLERVAKSKTNVFGENSLRQKKSCRDIDVGRVLRQLANKGLMNPVKRKVWQTTAIGRKVEHFLALKKLEEENPGLSRFIRK